MKFTCNVKVFRDAMAVLARVVERRNTYPILANVLIEVDVTSMKLVTTNLDIELRMEVSVIADAPFKITVPAYTLNEILRKYEAGLDVTIELEDKAREEIRISCARSRVSLATISADSFPELGAKGFTGEFETAGKEMARLLGYVDFAISTEETRYYLNGVYLHPISVQNVQHINFVATDGHRMARILRPVSINGTMAGIIVPTKTVKEIKSLCDAAGDDMVKFEVSDTRIRARHGSIVLLSKLIEGTFPDYERVMPRSANVVAMVDCAKLRASVDRVSTIASEKGGKAVKLIFTPSLLELSCSNADAGRANEEIDVDFEAENMEIGFSGRYLNDVLTVLGAGTVTMNLADAGSPALLTNSNIEGLQIVLMPMRV